jgi:uncharacterized protein YegP (UPF0339 family)
MDTKRNIVGPHFVIARAQRGGYGFSFKSASHAIVLHAAPFASVHEATAGIDAVRARIVVAEWPRRYQAADGTSYYFEIAHHDGALLATSVHYASRFAREVAIEMVELDAATAPVHRDE